MAPGLRRQRPTAAEGLPQLPSGSWSGVTTSASVLFVAHGSPMFALEPGAERGLDHGAWVPLRYLFPAAEVPVVPLSIQHHDGPEHAYQVGQALAPLVEQGWLIVASGNITHNLRGWQQARRGGGGDTSYVQRFSGWVAEQLSAGQVEALLHVRQQHPDARQAHPRDEHLLPLFTALGAAGPTARARAIHRGISDHVISMDSYAFELD